MNQIGIVILAAGNAKRMKQSKQLLPWGNSSLLGNVITNVLSTDADEVFVVLGAYKDEIKERTDLSQVITLVNENWQQGLGSTIAIATAEIDKKYPNISAVLLVLADQPFISSSHLNKMIELHKKDKEAIIMTKKDDYKGVPVLFPKKYFSELILLSNDEGAKQIINRNKNGVKELVTNDDTTDIDTFETYERLHESIKI